ncbi:MAG: hypothetical protein LBT74_13760 [Acidobacteriota bacterium]|jgi:hypothetical protein|nr:hypothetical protein [Acidobacteriota bacterium]
MTTAAAEKPVRPWGVCAVCLLAALLVWPTQRFIEGRAAAGDEDPDILLFSSPKMLKKMALGYDGLAADFYWMRTIQYYGRFDEADKRKVRYKNLYALLDITTTLDPYLTDAYRQGCFFLAQDPPLGAGDMEGALKFLDKGLEAHPDAWQLMYDKGFLHYLYTQDFKAAGDIWLQATKVPGAPSWLASLAAAALSRGGDFQIAFTLWQEQYRTTTRENTRKNARDRLMSFQVARDIWGWEALADLYKERAGAYPPTLRALAETRGRREKYALADPLGTPYRYDPQTGAVFLDADSKVNYIDVPGKYKNDLVAVDFLPGIP